MATILIPALSETVVPEREGFSEQAVKSSANAIRFILMCNLTAKRVRSGHPPRIYLDPYPWSCLAFRPVYAGKAFARVRSKMSPFLVFIRPNVFDLKE